MLVTSKQRNINLKFIGKYLLNSKNNLCQQINLWVINNKKVLINLQIHKEEEEEEESPDK